MTSVDQVEGHTPGPWRHDESEIYACEGSIQIAETVPLPGDNGLSGYSARELANARLLASAPELLAMVKEAAQQFRYYQAQHAAKGTPEADAKAVVNADLALRCEQAIARATGAA